MIIGISGACRSDELFKMKKEDIDILQNRISITIPTSKTYMSRSFSITDANWISIMKSYMNMNMDNKNEKLFYQVRSGKMTKQPVGHNTLAQFPKKIAGYLNLKSENEFTGHCFRRTAATLFANNGGDVLQLKRLGGWKSSSVAEGYVDSSSVGQVKIANMLSSDNNVFGEGTSQSTATNSNSVQKVNISSDKTQGLSVTINSHENSHITINFNNNN